MSATSQPQPPSPALIFDTLNAYQRTAALRAAIELDLFTAIAEGKKTARDLAARIQASEKGTRVLCDFLVIVGFLSKQGNEYGLTGDSAIFLDRKSPAYMGTIADFLSKVGPETGAFNDIAAVVRKGGTVISDEGTVSPDNPIWVNFARTMAPLMGPPSESIAKIVDADAGKKWKVLDIAAGHGLFGIAIGARYSKSPKRTRKNQVLRPGIPLSPAAHSM
jgi:hypothetical protein